ncbi:MAG: recombinase family protein, partial [Chloroflexi bacterium]|nr:recombinase family protein [Chloroflexota bacterium]
YARVSTDQQVERDSLLNQREQLKRFADLRGRQLKLYIDPGVSAKDKDRPAFSELVGDIERGLVDIVVVTKLDRITRSLQDLLWLLDFFQKHGVAFISISQQFDTASPVGRFGLNLLGSVAQLERELTADRVTEDMKARARRGRWNGGIAPHGFISQTLACHLYLEAKARASLNGNGNDQRAVRAEVKRLEADPNVKAEAETHARKIVPASKTLVINEEEAWVIREIFDLYLKHKSFRAVVHALNSQGHRTRNGETWAATSIRRILTNPNYYGALTYNKRRATKHTSVPRPVEEHITVEGALPEIISKERFEEVQRIIAAHGYTAPASKSSDYLLTGLVICEHCGGKLHGYTGFSKRGNRTYRYYRCSTHTSKGSAVCKGNAIDMATLENIVVTELKKLGLNPELLVEKTGEQSQRFALEVVPLRNKAAVLESKTKELERRSLNLIELYEQTLITKEEFVSRRKSLEAEKAAVEQELMNVRTELAANELSRYDIESVAGTLRTLGEVYDHLEFAERKELLRSVLSSVVVGKHSVTYNVFALPGLIVDSDHAVRGS